MIRHVPPFPATPRPGDRYPWGDTVAVVVAIEQGRWTWVVHFTVDGEKMQMERKRFLREAGR